MYGIPFEHPGARRMREFLGRNPQHGPGGFGPGGFRGFGPGFGPGGFGPGRPGRARRGDVRSAILSLLADGPSNGYGLIKAIAERTDGAWRPSPGSVYPTLQQLVDEELVEQTGTDRRSEYTLTVTGRTHVEQHRDEIDAAWQGVGADRAGWDDDFVQAARRLAVVVAQFPGSASGEQRAQATAKLDELRRELYRILAD